MTIALPFPIPAGNAYADNDGGNQVNQPPLGAPEGMATSTYNDVDRRNMTSIKQNVENISTINAALGDMAEQDSTAVNITGGTIDAAVSVAEAVNASQLGGVTLQALFDLIYPVNDSVVIRHIETPPPAWPGISATWTLIAEGFYPKFINSGQTVGQTFGAATTEPTVLTEAQLPPHDHKMFSNDVNSSGVNPGPTDEVARGYDGAGTSTEYRMRVGALAATVGATSSIGSGTGHTHDFDPPTYRLALYRRTA